MERSRRSRRGPRCRRTRAGTLSAGRESACEPACAGLVADTPRSDKLRSDAVADSHRHRRTTVRGRDDPKHRVGCTTGTQTRPEGCSLSLQQLKSMSEHHAIPSSLQLSLCRHLTINHSRLASKLPPQLVTL